MNPLANEQTHSAFLRGADYFISLFDEFAFRCSPINWGKSWNDLLLPHETKEALRVVKYSRHCLVLLIPSRNQATQNRFLLEHTNKLQSFCTRNIKCCLIFAVDKTLKNFDSESLRVAESYKQQHFKRNRLRLMKVDRQWTPLES